MIASVRAWPPPSPTVMVVPQHPPDLGRCDHRSSLGNTRRWRYGERLAEIGATPSIGTVGDALDNALMESTIGLFKTEIHAFTTGPFATWRDVEKAPAAWVHWFSHDRLHSVIGDVPPIEFETHHYAATTSPGQPAAA